MDGRSEGGVREGHSQTWHGLIEEQRTRVQGPEWSSQRLILYVIFHLAP